ncbi:short-chain dehydrogenase/reductase, partial [Burkholderia cepacia]|nr:short-chain dehydrogenase/reductase [Burkholderia cepacia]
MASGKLMLITGVSSGFGRALAQEALAAGYTVVGT